MGKLDLVATTAKEQLERWDRGESIWSIEMGGLGPGYEQAIQILAIEIVRDHLGKPLEPSHDWADDTVNRLDVRLPNGTYPMGGFSGAQVGAAKYLAYRWLRDGPAQVLKEVDSDRHIQVSSFLPHVPKP